MRNNQVSKTSQTRIQPLMILAALGLATSVSTAAPHAQPESAEQFAVSSSKNVMSELVVYTPDEKQSIAHISGTTDANRVMLRNKVVVTSSDVSVIRSLIAQHSESMGKITLQGNVGSRVDIWEITTQDVRTAIEFADAIKGVHGIQHASVDQGTFNDRAVVSEALAQRMLNAPQNSGSKRFLSKQAPGIQPAGGSVNPAGVLDPDLANFWHLQNTLPIFLGRDNNITQDIYDVMGYTGEGVTIGLSRQGFIQHLDFDHNDITANYDTELTMPVDTSLFPSDRRLTSLAGLMVAGRNNGFNGHGIAPNAMVAGLSTGTDLLLANLLEYEKDQVDIKILPVTNEFSDMTDNYNEGFVDDYVKDSFDNGIRFGRNKKGGIYVFSGGFNAVPFASGDSSAPAAPFFPDPYDGNGLIDMFGDPAELEVSGPIDLDERNGYVSGPFFLRAQAYLYPFASNRNTFLINGVDENGFADMNQAIGTAVFASVYSGTSNASTYWDNAGTLPRGIFSTTPGNLTSELPLRTSDWFVGDQFFDLVEANGNSAAIAGGIIALMLEANPDLSIRDIQHILFESIYDSTFADRPISIRFPDFDPNQGYLLGGANQFNGRSLWQVNTALRDTPNGPMAIRHSDQYGFGVIDAELAVTKAATWSGSPKLVKLDTGLLDEDTDPLERVPLEIPDATFVEVSETVTQITPGITTPFRFCVRNNIQIETIVVELSIEGLEGNDLHIQLVSPFGTYSNLTYPTSYNTFGTSYDENFGDDDTDANAFSVSTDGTAEFAFNNHEFTTFKHWGELSGGVWSIRFTDFGPDETNVTGSPRTDPDGDPSEPNTLFLDPFELAGSSTRSEKELVEFRVSIYGSEIGEQPFLGCDPLLTSCPADLNADGIVDLADFLLFISWYQANDARADIDANGLINFQDITAYRGIFVPGFCTTADSPPFQGGRPRPGGTDFGDSNPPTRPI